ncbi:xylan 1,4-beta-xylosidase [Lachnospiraceae bacterium PF1-21]|uniref:helix-turn-helix domain-containing protein n=1 Tax=Ohessyouella blattaphilus TaxID=2949333 RepID=UPI003E2FAAAC
MFTKEVKISLLSMDYAPSHVHTGIQCILMLKGSVEVVLEEGSTTLNGEDLFVINENVRHEVIPQGANVALILRVEKDYISRENEEFANRSIFCHCIGHSDENSHYYGLKNALIRMLYIISNKEDGYYLDFKVELLRFIFILYTRFFDKEIEQEKQRGEKSLEEILRYIQQNHARSLKLEEVAKIAYMSPQYFSRRFKAKVGKGFHEYLTEFRLQKAVKSLVGTDDSLIKIALDHGFANGKSFSEAFKKEYQETPGNYRKHHLRQSEDKGDEERFYASDISFELDIELKDVMRYLKKYEMNTGSRTLNKTAYEIPMTDKLVDVLVPQENILNIGRVTTAGYTNLYAQLPRLRERLGFKYVYFELEYNFVVESVDYSLVVCNQFFRLVDKLRSEQLIPMIKIVPEAIYKKESSANMLVDLDKKIDIFIRCISAVYPRNFIESWKFNICYEEDFGEEYRFAFYRKVWHRLKKAYPKIHIGYYGLSDDRTESREHLQKVLGALKQEKIMPDFFTFGIFPASIQGTYLKNKLLYSSMEGYHKEMVTAVKECFVNLGIQVPPLYLVEWNTLKGSIATESILYFRSALIVNALLAMNKVIRGAGYWADSSVASIYSKEETMSDLALHMLDDVRRPIYPVLEIMNRIGSHMIYREKNVIASITEGGDYAILLWNPKYLNPTYSVDDTITDSLTENIEIKLTNLTDGVYQIKKVVCNKQQSGAITQITNAGYPDFNDGEVFEYIQYNIANGLSVYDENIYDGSYVLNTDLLYNAVVLYMITKKRQS